MGEKLHAWRRERFVGSIMAFLRFSSKTA